MPSNEYWAGLFDGEGCIIIGSRLRKETKTLHYDLMVQISMVDEKPLRLLKEQFGGKVVAKSRRTSAGRVIFCWRLYSNQAAEFLRSIYPYLLIKHEQAELALKFQDGIKRTTKPTSPEELQRRECIKTAIASLNYGPNNGVVKDINLSY